MSSIGRSSDDFTAGIFQNALRSASDALFVINDFNAVAHSLPVLGEEQGQIGEGTAKENGNIAVFDLVQDWVLSIHNDLNGLADADGEGGS